MIEYGDDDNDNNYDGNDYEKNTIPYTVIFVSLVAYSKASTLAARIRRRSGVWWKVISIAPLPQIAAMWLRMEKTWASMFEFMEPYWTPDAGADFAEITVADVAYDPPATASYVEVSIHIDLAFQRLWVCTLENLHEWWGINDRLGCCAGRTLRPGIYNTI